MVDHRAAMVVAAAVDGQAEEAEAAAAGHQVR